MSIEDINDSGLRKILLDSFHLVDEFVTPKNISLKNADSNYRENVAPHFRNEVAKWRDNYKGNNADELLKAARKILSTYYQKALGKN